jgi:hypothetical protein
VAVPLKVRPLIWNFGPVRIGGAVTKKFNLRNPASSGTPPITLQRAEADETDGQLNFGFPNAANFTCFVATTVLPPKHGCSLLVEFAPMAPAGTKLGTLTIFDNAGNANQIIQLRGVAK